MDHTYSRCLRTTCRQEGSAATATLDANPLMLSCQISEFLFANAHSHGGQVEIGSYVLDQLRHEGLTESLYFGFALVKRIDITSTHCRSNGIPCQPIAKHRIKRQTLDRITIHMTPKMQCPLIRTQTARILNPISTIHTYHTRIIQPRHTELDHPLRFHQLLRHEGIAGITLKDGIEGGHDRCHRTDELRFVSIASICLGD
mmetsp:Transcript_16386/g.24598  ORF Transcript_16386/g.24598 Transcript_16386/m.24598 type:complete len:201 (-) Transcript_16386:409-1011(-)